ncbi:hypothetical protein [Neorhizobium sp. LjRoot104]|uniref:hypothetical protein n=1 Tax=Neorhizobium sp. LjRoot104 TaxID=3342254 RepID=UPI003ECFC573
MTKLQQIEKAVTHLDRQEFEAFSLWFEGFQAERWDRQIKIDDAESKSTVSQRMP